MTWAEIVINKIKKLKIRRQGVLCLLNAEKLKVSLTGLGQDPSRVGRDLVWIQVVTFVPLSKGLKNNNNNNNNSNKYLETLPLENYITAFFPKLKLGRTNNKMLSEKLHMYTMLEKNEKKRKLKRGRDVFSEVF